MTKKIINILRDHYIESQRLLEDEFIPLDELHIYYNSFIKKIRRIPKSQQKRFLVFIDINLIASPKDVKFVHVRSKNMVQYLESKHITMCLGNLALMCVDRSFAGFIAFLLSRKFVYMPKEETLKHRCVNTRDTNGPFALGRRNPKTCSRLIFGKKCLCQT